LSWPPPGKLTSRARRPYKSRSLAASIVAPAPVISGGAGPVGRIGAISAQYLRAIFEGMER
jgi:hypothetical protein